MRYGGRRKGGLPAKGVAPHPPKQHIAQLGLRNVNRLVNNVAPNHRKLFKFFLNAQKAINFWPIPSLPKL